MQTHQFTGKLALVAIWHAKAGQDDAVAKILEQMAPQAQQEPGVQAFIVHRVEGKQGQFVLYEVFDDEDAFAKHQETSHFRSLIADQALPLLAKRDRIRLLPV
jgi:quinol monooxygenase YgiN